MGKLDKFGCACRALMKLAELHGETITEDEFLAKFGSRFLIGKWGLTDSALVCDLAREMRLARGVQVTRDYDLMERVHASGSKQGVLVQVERFPDPIDPTKLSILYHTMLLEKIDAKEFQCWTWLQTGSPQSLRPFPRVNWDRFLAHALILT